MDIHTHKYIIPSLCEFFKTIPASRYILHIKNLTTYTILLIITLSFYLQW